MKIEELRPFQKRVELNVKLTEKNEAKEVSSKLDGSTHKVAEVMIGDGTGTVLLTLWDDMIDKVEVDKNYKIANAYTSLFKNTLRLNIGRYGTIEESTEEVGEVNKGNNLSEKEFERRPRSFGGGSRDSYGGGRSRGGFGGGSRGGYGGGRGQRAPRKEESEETGEAKEEEEETGQEEDFSDEE